MTDTATVGPVLRVAAKALIVDENGRLLILREASTYDEGTNHGKYHVLYFHLAY